MTWTPPSDAKEVKQEPSDNSAWVPPSDAKEVKKKEVGAPSSGGGQLLGSFVQSQKLDLNQAPSTSPSTKPTQQPAFIRNNNLYTGSKPSYRGAYDPRVEENNFAQYQSGYDPKFDSYEFYSKTPSQQVDAMQAKPKNQFSDPSLDQYEFYSKTPSEQVDMMQSTSARPDRISPNADVNSLYDYGKRFEYIVDEQKAIAAQTPGTPENDYVRQVQLAEQNPGVASMPSPLPADNTLDYARRFRDYYLLNTNPDKRSDDQRKLEFYTSPEIEKTPDNMLLAQTAQANIDLEAIDLYSKSVNRSREINEKIFDETYGSQKAAFEEVYKNLQEWPKGPDGQPIINTPEEERQYNTWYNTSQTLLSDEGFTSAAKAVDNDIKKLQSANLAYQEVIRNNPLPFIAQAQADQKRQETEASLKALGPVFEWKVKNIDNPATMAVVDFAMGVSYLPKAFGDGDEFGWTDDLYNKAALGKTLAVDPYLPIEDGIVAQTVSAATTMAIMVGTGYGVGAAMGGSAGALMAGQAVAGTVATMEGYYRAGKEAGMSESEAESYSVVSGVVQGMLEMVNPEAAFGATVANRSANAYMKVLATGGTKSLARQEAMKAIVKNVAAENAQELLQQVSEWGVNMKANQITGSSLDTGKKWGETLKETAIITTLISSVVGGIQGSSSSNRMQGEVLYTVGSSPEVYRNRTAQMITSGDITPEKGAEINAKINEAEQVYKRIPSYMKPEDAVRFAPTVLYKYQLEQELKNVDKAFKPEVEQKIQEVEQQIQTQADIKTEEQIKDEGEQRVMDEDELGNLKIAQQMGVLNETEQTRLAELETKMAPVKVEDQKAGINNSPVGDMTVQELEAEYDYWDNASYKLLLSEEESSKLPAGESLMTPEAKRAKAVTAELEKRERESILNVPVSESKKNLIKLQEKERLARKGKGPDTFAERGEILQAQNVLAEYSNAADFSDNKIISDFDRALKGNPKTDLADGLLLRESYNEASRRGILPKLIEKAKAEYVEAGYENEALDVVASKLKDALGDVTYIGTVSAKVEDPKAGKRLFSEPVEEISSVSESYKKQKGIDTPSGENINTIDVEEAKRRADAFEQMKHDPNNPEVKEAYEAMASETMDQFNSLKESGYTVEIFEGKGEPYANSQEMLKDLKENKHLYVLSTEKEFGQGNITEEQRNENPLLKDSGATDVNGKPLLVNDVFRFVHDAFGHGERGNSFGAIGEENAWDVHARMFSPKARRAMTTETRGQNSWVNFGPHLRNPDGSIKKIDPKEKPFAEQKIGLLPEWVSQLPEEKQSVQTDTVDTLNVDTSINKKPRVNVDEPKPTDLTDEEMSEVEVVDDVEVVAKLDKDLETIKKLTAGGVGQKAKAVDARISQAVKDGKLTQDTADAYTQKFNDVVKGRVGEIKSDATKRIDEVADALIAGGKKIGLIGKGTVTIDGKEVPISKSSMLDIEGLVKFSAEMLKRAVSKGIDIKVAYGNLKASIQTHPKYKRLIESGALSAEQYEKLVFTEYGKAVNDIEEMQADLDKKNHRAAEYLEDVMKSSDPAFVEGIKQMGLEYIPQSNSMQASDARRYVEYWDGHGELEGLKSLLSNMTNGMTPDVRVMIGIELMDKFQQKAKALEGVEKDAMIKNAGEVLGITLKAGEFAARGVQNMKLLKKKILENAGPETAMMIMGETFQETADKAADQISGKISGIVNKLNKQFAGKQVTFEEINGAVKNTFGDLSEKASNELMKTLAKEFNETGKLTKGKVKEEYSKALFSDIFSPDRQQYLKEQAEITANYTKKAKDYDSNMHDLKTQYLADIAGVSASEVSKRTVQYKRDIIDLSKELQKAQFEAEKAHEKISKELAGPRDFWKTIQWGIKFGFLGVHSTAVNFSSNTFMALPRMASGTNATLFDIITTPLWKLKGNSIGENIGRSHNLRSQLSGLKKGTPFAAKEAWHRIWSGTPDVESMDKYEVHANVRVVDALRDLMKKKEAGVSGFRNVEDKIAAAYEGIFGIHHVPIARLMGAGDAMPREMARMAKLHEIATTQKGLKDPSDIMDFVFNPDPNSKALAEDWAKKLVYQQESGFEGRMIQNFNTFIKSAESAIIAAGTDKETGEVSDVARHMAGMIGTLRTVTFPFMKTITNMMPEFIYMALPGAGFTSAAVKSGVANKYYNKAAELDDGTAHGKALAEEYRSKAWSMRNQAASDFGKGTIAMLVAAVAKGLFDRGLLTGKLSDDEKEQALEYMNIKPYSLNWSAIERWASGDDDWYVIRPGDDWKVYDQMGTVGMAMGAHAAWLKNNQSIPGQEESMSILQSMFGTVPEIVSKAMDMSFTKGTSAMIQAMREGGNKWERFQANTLFGLATAVFPNDISAYNKSRDQFLRETLEGPSTTAWDIFENRWQEATGRGEQLPAKVDFFGNKVNRVPAGADPMFYMFVSPTRGYNVDTQSAGYQIYQTYKSLPNGSAAKSKMVPSEVGWTLKPNRYTDDILLTPKEHEKLQIIVGKKREAMAKDYIFSSEWQNDSAEDRAERLNYIWSTGATAGKYEFIDQSERIQQIISGIPASEATD